MNTSCNSVFQKDLLPPIYGVEFCVAVVGNIMTLWLLVTKERKNWHTGVVFSCNLVISNILYALSLPLLIIYYSKGHRWHFGDFVCKMERFLFTCNLYMCIYFIMCITVNQYLAIVHPVFKRNHVRPIHAKIASVLVWITVAVMSSPILYYSGAKEERCSNFLDPKHKSIQSNYRVCMTVMGFLFPFVITFVTNLFSIRKVFKNTNITSTKKKKVALIVAVVCTLYTMSFGPYHVLLIWKLLHWQKDVKNCYVNDAYQVTKAFACLNMCLHPILYVTVFDSKKTVCCRKSSDV